MLQNHRQADAKYVLSGICVDKDLAEKMNEIFLEVVFAAGFTEDAVKVLIEDIFLSKNIKKLPVSFFEEFVAFKKSKQNKLK